jgi:hypothetical protein
MVRVRARPHVVASVQSLTRSLGFVAPGPARAAAINLGPRRRPSGGLSSSYRQWRRLGGPQRKLDRRLDELSERSIDVIAISAERREGSEQLQTDCKLERLPIRLRLTEPSLRQWGPFVSPPARHRQPASSTPPNGSQRRRHGRLEGRCRHREVRRGLRSADRSSRDSYRQHRSRGYELLITNDETRGCSWRHVRRTRSTAILRAAARRSRATSGSARSPTATRPSLTTSAPARSPRDWRPSRATGCGRPPDMATGGGHGPQ